MIKRIPGFTGYEISDDGKHVYSYWTMGVKSYCDWNRKPRELRQALKSCNHGKYKSATVRLRVGPCDSRSMTVHRLVALTFLPNPLNKPCVAHLNDISTQNHVGNLAWVDKKTNNIQRLHNNLNDITIEKLQAELAEYKNKITVADIYAELAA